MAWRQWRLKGWASDDSLTWSMRVFNARRRFHHSKKPNHWWNPEILLYRSPCLWARRLCQGIRVKQQYSQMEKEYRDLQRLQVACLKVDTNSWGAAYKFVIKKIRAEKWPKVTCLRFLIKTIPIVQEESGSQPEVQRNVFYIIRVIEEELQEICERIEDNKTSWIRWDSERSLEVER